MFKWIKRKTDVTPKPSIPSSGYDPAGDDPLVSKIFYAATVIDVLPDQDRSEMTYIGEVAYGILRLANQNETITGRSDRLEYLDGVFLLCTCDLLCHHMRISFELTGASALCHLYSIEDIRLKASEAIDNYNLIIKSNSTIPPTITTWVKRWIEMPVTQNGETLKQVYSLLLRELS